MSPDQKGCDQSAADLAYEEEEAKNACHDVP